MSQSLPELQAITTFEKEFGIRPDVLGRAPGRLELLGNHTDYNGGLVLAVAIDRYTAIAGRSVSGRRAGPRVGIRRRRVPDRRPLGRRADRMDTLRARRRLALGETRELTAGFDVAIAGDVPLGAGLSSSASLQAALATFLLASGVVADGQAQGDDRKMALAQTLQRSENHFVGVASGLLDQFTVLFGREGEAVALDCRDLAFERLPLGTPPPAIVVCDSQTSRRLADGMYNRRRGECETVVAHFQRLRGESQVQWLRDITLDELNEAWNDLDPVGRLRARHVLSENARVRAGMDALHRGDVATFGRLMSASHASSRDDFANSAPRSTR